MISVNLGFVFLPCIVFLSFVLFLYYKDPVDFIVRVRIRFLRLKYRINHRFETKSKHEKEKIRSLSMAISQCEETICKYIYKKKGKTITFNKKLQAMYEIYNKLNEICISEPDTYTLEDINNYLSEMYDLYDPWSDPFYTHEDLLDA